MGKRELVILLAFIVAGTIAFQFSAAPARESQSGFSLSKLLDAARRGIRGNQSYMAPPRTLTFAVGPDITQLSIAGSSGGPIKILGEARTDISLELTVASTGENEAAAIATANRTTVSEDRVGSLLALRVVFPQQETQTSQAVLRIPARLGVQLDGTRETSISNVRSVDLTNPARGTTSIDHIAEQVTGTQNGGTITLASIKSLKATLTRTRARISDVTGTQLLEVSDGDTEITASQGPLEIEERRGDITIRGQRGPVKISGADGQVRIIAATDEVHLDLRRTEVDAELATGVGGSLVTSDEELRVTWHDPAGVRVDAVAANGSIDAADWGHTATTSPVDARLDLALGTESAAAPRVSLRNQGANIVLKKSSKK